MYNKKRNAKRRTIRVSNGVDRVIDENGEIVSEVFKFKDVLLLDERRRWCSMMLDDDLLFDFLNGLGNQGKVWGFVLLKYDKDNCVFYFGASIKEMCEQITGLSDGTIRSAIRGFCDSGMLLKIRNAEYMVNPKAFYTGNFDNRQKMIDVFEEKQKALETLKSNKPLNDKINEADTDK